MKKIINQNNWKQNKILALNLTLNTIHAEVSGRRAGSIFLRKIVSS